jgi:hypothetical protein
MLPTVATQFLQRQIQTRFLVRVLAGDRPVGTPPLVRLLARHPVLQGVPARLIGIGVLPEHAPPAAREPAGTGSAPASSRRPSVALRTRGRHPVASLKARLQIR